MLPPMHCASPEHTVRHWPLSPQTYGSQGCPVVGRQAPALQRKASVMVDPVQEGCLHSRPVGYLRQAPAPSQTPSRPQLATPSSGHSLRGSLETSAGRQVPRVPADAHEWQGAEQSVLQQTPSKQYPLWHSVPTAHGLPSTERGISPFGAGRSNEPSPAAPPSTDAPPPPVSAPGASGARSMPPSVPPPGIPASRPLFSAPPQERPPGPATARSKERTPSRKHPGR
jgi:hypothetical protein